jgi:hypothetical protein
MSLIVTLWFSSPANCCSVSMVVPADWIHRPLSRGVQTFSRSLRQLLDQWLNSAAFIGDYEATSTAERAWISRYSNWGGGWATEKTVFYYRQWQVIFDRLYGLVVTSSWLQIQRSGLDSRHYQIFWEIVGLERCPLSLMSTTEELLGRKSSGSGIGNRDYRRRDSSRWPRKSWQ